MYCDLLTMEHCVVQGECLSSIAHKYGFGDYRKIYDHPDNADFKKKRPNPNVIYPGDVLVIPDFEAKTEDCGTESRHKFRAKKLGTKVRIVLASDDGQAYGGKRYLMTIDGQHFQGKTTSAGLVEQVIPPDAKSGELVIFLNDGDGIEGYSFPLELGALDPPDQVSGAQARLLNLGFDCGSANGTIDDSTKAALEAFQEKQGLTVSGDLDDATIKKLRELHEE